MKACAEPRGYLRQVGHEVEDFLAGLVKKARLDPDGRFDYPFHADLITGKSLTPLISCEKFSIPYADLNADREMSLIRLI